MAVITDIMKDLPALVEKVREVADRYPDQVYVKSDLGGCSYQSDELNPYGCIIGCAMGELGCINLDKLSSAGNVDNLWYIYGPVDQIHETPAEIYWLMAVQEKQDQGAPWGLCVKSADTQMEPYQEPAGVNRADDPSDELGHGS